MEALGRLRQIEQGVADEFAETRRVMGFDDFFGMFIENPALHCRTAAEYLRDCIDYYGRVPLEQPTGEVIRCSIFDCPFDDTRDRLVGQEDAQMELYRVLNNFIQERRISRLVLLHGPNGSAKSSFIACLARGLEDYCTRDEGAIYRFSWLFPSHRIAKKRLGFGEGGDTIESTASYVDLDDEDIDSRIPGDLHDHPLLLLPKDRRRDLIHNLQASGVLGRDIYIGEYLLEGGLSPRSRAIVDALLTAYHGDFQRVLQHVQVERFFFSRRYRAGVVTIEPQMHVDAGIRQVTADQGLASLPSSLHHLDLFEPFGDLVDANRGMIEFNDLLKKPLDSYKYLLATCEKGTVALPNAILHLDVLFLASSNEKHLNAFKEYQDFPSFKGRMDLIKMPYLRNHRVERKIYWEQLVQSGLADRVAPHSTYCVALWAVLTRLKQPMPELYPESLREALTNMTALEKAELYAGERDPSGISPEEGRDLRAHLQDVLDESQDEPDYEGASGASPREMKEVMLNALQGDEHEGLSPLGIFDELRNLVKMKSVYEFLKDEPAGGYRDHEAFIDQVFERWMSRVDEEVRTSMGLVSDRQYVDLFSRYILHVSYLLKGEKVYSEATGQAEDPDTHLMEELERIWGIADDPEGYRRDLVSRVGAWRIDYPGEEMDYRRLFPKLFRQLEEDYYERQRETIHKMSQDILHVLNQDLFPEEERSFEHLAEGELERANETMARLETDYGYQRWAMREAIGTLLNHRY